jgi:hypothetical protein
MNDCDDCVAFADPEREVEHLRSAMKQRRPVNTGLGASHATSTVEEAIPHPNPNPNPPDCVTNMSTLETPSAPKINVRLFGDYTDADRSMNRSILKSGNKLREADKGKGPPTGKAWFGGLFGGRESVKGPADKENKSATPAVSLRTPRARALSGSQSVSRNMAAVEEEETDFFLITSYAILCAFFSVLVALLIKIYF